MLETRFVDLFYAVVSAFLVCSHHAHGTLSTKTHRERKWTEKLGGHFDVSAQCGAGWQAWYQKLHANILQKPLSEQRFAVAQVTYNGLGDRLASTVSVFYFAMLTGRAFRIQWWEYEETVHPALESAVSSPYIDWKSVPSDRLPGSTHIEDHPESQSNLHPFGHINLGDIGNVSRTVWWKANTGSLDELFYNPYHRQQLFDWGVRPETATGCALAYLFRPRPETLDLVRDNYRELKDKAALKIGVHVRYGDDYLKGAPGKGICQGDVQDKSDWWACAKKIEEEYHIPGQRIIWYVMSDCAGLPFRVAERFGDKVLLPSLDARVEHIDHFTNNRTNDILVLRSTFAEHYLFSMTDFQVITDISSYGKLAALRSLKYRSIFVIKTLYQAANKRVGCHRSNFDTFEYLANSWVKI